MRRCSECKLELRRRDPPCCTSRRSRRVVVVVIGTSSSHSAHSFVLLHFLGSLFLLTSILVRACLLLIDR